LFNSSLLTYIDLDFLSLENGIGLYGGLFIDSSNTHTFHLFVLLLSAVILSLTAFYPRKV
jgi:NADH-ubiquinone oxidoreductase chain 2